MNLFTERDIDPLKSWIGVIGGLFTILVAGVIAFPSIVYERFIWQYFWGPIVADAQPGECAVRTQNTVELMSGAECSSAESAGHIVAYSGYTIVSTLGYISVLLLAIGGVYLGLRQFDIGSNTEFFYAMIPFVFFGGGLRTIEDVSLAAVANNGEPLISYPLSALLISPIIYGTVFAITVGSLVCAVVLEKQGIVEQYHRALFSIGCVVLAVVLLSLGYIGMSAEYATINSQVLTIVLLAATIGTILTWVFVNRFEPSVNAGTGFIGFVIIWGHAIDGAANVVGLDYMEVLNAGQNLVPKHPLNTAIVEFFGVAWPFFIFKLVAATLVVWVFDDEIMNESPRFAILMLVTVLAVGLGPGTRDLLRATIGV